MPLFLVPFLLRARTLLANPLVQYGLAFLAVLLLLVGIYWKGHSDGYASCDASHKAASAAEVLREAKVAEKVTDNSVRETTENKAEDKANGDKVAVAVAKIRATPVPKPETVVVIGKKVDEPSFADAVCIPSDVADELRSLH